MKKFAILLCVVLSMTTMGVMADTGEAMAAAITTARERVEIPAECTAFSGYKNVYAGRTSWELSWETPSGAEKHKNVRVTVSESGIIESVYTYENVERERKTGKTLPTVSTEKAMETAIEACAVLNPSLKASYQEGGTVRLSGESYAVTVPRMEGGIPVYNNSANLRISILTGQMESYSLSHTETAVFGSAEGAMDTSAAEAAFIKNGFMELWYRPMGDTMRLVYVPGRANSLIDAFSGEPFSPTVSEEFRTNSAMKEEAAQDTVVAGGAALTPAERQAVEETAGLLSYEEAAERLKQVPFFGIPQNATVESGNTYKQADGKYILRVSLALPTEQEYRYTYGELDGKTGEILTFYSDRNIKEEAKPSAETAKTTYEAFCKSYLSEYMGSLAAPEITVQKAAASVVAQRTENEVPVYGNTVYMTVTEDGLIENYRCTFDKAAVFEEKKDILTMEEAYATLFKKGAPYPAWYAENETASLIYAAAEREFAFIAATDGSYLMYGGTPYAEKPSGGYTDIDGHYAKEAILALSAIGADFGSGACEPDSMITQKEYVGLVSNCIMEYYPILDGAADEARLYAYAVNRGILPKDEEAPNAPLTREMATAYLLRAMGYKEFAAIPDIFKCDFTDSDSITPALFGYVAIARGLGIVSGTGEGAFQPQRHVTRGEAAVMIYNYLK